MLNGIIKNVVKNIQLINGYSEELFIGCTSFEDRTIAVANKLSSKYNIEYSFIFKYDEKNKTTLRDQNYQLLKNKLLKHSKNVFPIICDHHDPLDGIYTFRKLCKDKDVDMSGKNMTIDITTFTKQYILVLLKFIEAQKPKSVRLYYTEPEEYAVKWDKPLSYGLIDIVSIPTYGGHFYTEKESLLIILLGYEGDRAYKLWEKLTPHKTIILIGKPSYKNSWEGSVEKFNMKLISKLPKDSVNYIPALDPFEVSKSLSHLIDQHLEKFNIFVSALGPKPQLLGCYLSIRNYPDVQMIYAIPKFHNEKYFSKKIGEIWEYR